MLCDTTGPCPHCLRVTIVISERIVTRKGKQILEGEDWNCGGHTASVALALVPFQKNVLYFRMF